MNSVIRKNKNIFKITCSKFILAYTILVKGVGDGLKSNNIQYKALVKAFSDDYLAKIYYYCLKKTSSTTEAEELSSDITLNILTALEKGTIPANFPAWVWKIARNRYSAWATQKRMNHERFHNIDEEENQAGSGENIESAFIESETLSILRRELAFISKEYREILVAFYIDDLKAKTIAGSLNIPVGTVTSKLTRARNILKEGMNMAREFGIRSYKPEEVKFTVDGDRDPSVPLQRPLPKNIILEAHGNPSTLEQLSVEIGVALPYMEDEVKRLVDAELLVEENGKYITNFLIASKEAQLEIYNALRKKSKERSALFNKIISDILPELREMGIVSDRISDNDFKFTVLTIAADEMNRGIEGYMGWPSIFKRKNGGTWGIMGYEIHDLISENLLVSGDMTGGGNQGFFAMRYVYDAYHKEVKLGSVFALLGGLVGKFIADIVQHQRNTNSFTRAEKEIWENVSRDGLLATADKDGNVLLNFVTFMMGEKKKFDATIKTHPNYNILKEAYSELFNEVKALLLKHSHARFEETINYYVSDFMEHTTMTEKIPGYEEIYGDIKPSQPFMGLEGDALIEKVVGGPFELGEEKSATNKDGVVFSKWRVIKLSAPPPEYPRTCVGNVMGTEKGDVILFEDGNRLYIDVGPHPSDPDPRFRSYFAINV